MLRRSTPMAKEIRFIIRSLAYSSLLSFLFLVYYSLSFPSKPELFAICLIILKTYFGFGVTV